MSSSHANKLLLAMALAALVVTAARGARTGPRGHGGGAEAGAARISALELDDASRSVPSCCTQDRSKGGSSCCPPQALTP
ncbi:hypothetical protein SETIT_9G116300v2 [Setaria italica]|uniref:Uncharacterized protein n=1 Tax=Setaria italica TaxID=4555 RepID=A0A368SFH9_SETIT|nr:hypothetical protein SETIT_9G116300v2 [Setaria italica]